MKPFARMILVLSSALAAAGAWAELPPSIVEVLFGLTEGNVACGKDYGQWVKSDGTVVFVKRFGVFDKGEFCAYADNSKNIHLIYKIEMRQVFEAPRTFDDVVLEIRGMEQTLLKELYSPCCFSITKTANSYRSICEDIDSQGWNVTFSALQDTNGTVVVTASFDNALHRNGKWVSCEDLFNDTTDDSQL